MKKYLYLTITCILGIISLASCSTNDVVENEYIDWKAKNEGYFESAFQTTVAKQAEDPNHWKVIKSHTKDKDTPGDHTEYILMQVLDTQGKTYSPTFSDSVRVHYRGYFIPSESYHGTLYGNEVGFMFDSSFFGKDIDLTRDIPTTFALGGTSLITGFATALQHMHPGDHCLVTIPYQLAYGDTETETNVPLYSTLIFEIWMHSFTKAGTPFPTYQ